MHQIVVDTDVLILHLRGDESVRTLLREAAHDALLCCSPITIGEIHAGMRDEEREKTERLLNSLMVIDVDRKIAALAGDYRRTIRSHQLELDDCLIAATCFIHRTTLFTCNVKHYPMEGFEKKNIGILR
ncbi:MAG: type II toxin-antitoxin system VapC family toxin [Deltaproteobacteria bacterium]|nr:type II toxin-antitoxin system VapC family toxin [Deltaproteobacteria bacterium]